MKRKTISERGDMKHQRGNQKGTARACQPAAAPTSNLPILHMTPEQLRNPHFDFRAAWEVMNPDGDFQAAVNLAHRLCLSASLQNTTILPALQNGKGK